MNLLVPLSNIDELDDILKLNVDEIYTGVNIPSLKIVNRRPSKNSNLSSIDELIIAIEKCISNKTSLYLTINEMFYSERDFNNILSKLLFLISKGLTGIIIVDPNLLLFLNKYNIHKKIEIHLSTCCSVYNSNTIFFYKKFGVKRIILPRHLSIVEINNLVSSDDSLDYEVIILNTRCINDDGLCSFEHSLKNLDPSTFEGGGCGLNYNAEFVNNSLDISEIEKNIILNRMKKIQANLLYACGACNIYNLKQMGIKSIKIVGREFSLNKKLKDILFLKSIIEYITKNENIKEKDYKKFSKGKYKEIYGKQCSIDQCYY